MNSTETIQAAIDKLNHQRGTATAAPWARYDDGMLAGISGQGGFLDVVDAGEVRVSDIDLIVTLHRTIDAQLAVLRSAGGVSRGAGYVWPYAFNLAVAILGDSA